MNALVLHVGNQAIEHIHSKGLTPSMSTIAHSSHMDIFQNLAVDLDTEGTHLDPDCCSDECY
jgi:CCR4-NOT transcription complex subunit 1